LASTVLITLIGKHWTDERRWASVRGLNRFARIYPPVFLAGLALVYGWLVGRG
jgi:hypothetical protein